MSLLLMVVFALLHCLWRRAGHGAAGAGWPREEHHLHGVLGGACFCLTVLVAAVVDDCFVRLRFRRCFPVRPVPRLTVIMGVCCRAVSMTGLFSSCRDAETLCHFLASFVVGWSVIGLVGFVRWEGKSGLEKVAAFKMLFGVFAFFCCCLPNACLTCNGPMLCSKLV